MKQKELTELLIKASDAYYNTGAAIMSDLEFDRKLEELRNLEKESGIVYPGSPTQSVGATIRLDGLQTVTHEKSALSLDKIKYKDADVELKRWFGDQTGVVSWKMDGLTVVLTYDNGKLTQAVTRGNGIAGKDVIHNAVYFEGIPKTIEYLGHLIVRGEAVMEYREFERLNAEAGGIYENPRNLAAATVQMLDPSFSKYRKISFYAFELVNPEPTAYDGIRRCRDTITASDKKIYHLHLFSERMMWLSHLGFQTVSIGTGVTADNVGDVITRWEKDLHEGLPFPTDGLVFTYDDLEYGWGLGTTGKFPHWAIALKWTDETKKTVLRNVEWSVGKTGLVTPVAIFEPVRLGVGSTITRASLHNISCLRSVPLRNGAHMGEYESMCLNDSVDVYLANMIIPQIASYGHDGDYTLEHKRTAIEIPSVCPVCGKPLRQEESNGVWTLHCDNNNCGARVIGALMNTLGKDGLDIKGLSEKKIAFLLEEGFVENVLDFYRLKDQGCGCGVLRKETWIKNHPHHTNNLPGPALEDMPGWEVKSVDNLLAAIEASRKTTLQKFLYSLNIPLLGNDLSKKLSKYWHDDIDQFVEFINRNHSIKDGWERAREELTAIDGVGEEKAWNVISWMDEVSADCERYEDLVALINELEFPKTEEVSSDSSLAGLTFVITGSVHEYKHRDEFTASVEARGGKVAGSVSAKTTALICNEISSSTKSIKARELGIPVLSEVQFIEKYGA